MTDRLRQIADSLGAQIIEEFAGGHFGAVRVRTASGIDGVLKVLPAWPELALDRVLHAVTLVDRVRQHGYPVPRFLDVGTIGTDVYTLQAYVAGSVPNHLTLDAARHLIALWRMHEGAASPMSDGQWGAAMIARVRRAKEVRSDCDDPHVLAVLDRALEIADAADPTAFRTGDLVHGDFHHGNVLVRDDAVAAVIDWEEAHEGDSRADLLRLYATAAAWQPPDSPVIALLRDELDATTPPEVWLPIGADIAVQHVRYGLLASPGSMSWVLRSADVLLAG